MHIGKFVCIVMVAMVSMGAATPSPAPVFFDARLEPPAGRVISGWGQFSSAWDLGEPAGKGDAEGLAAYEKVVAPHPPAMIAFDVGPDFTIVSGFLNHYREFAAAHGFFLAEVTINFRGIEHDVAIGMRDPDVIVLADGLHDVGRPVLMRIGSDFNTPGALYEPSGYIGAFRHATDTIRKAHLNCATVWSATVQGLSNAQQMKWYPGDDVVDWWGIDLSDARDFSRAATRAFVDAAAHHRKPVVISAAVRGLKTEAEGLKWYASFFDFIGANPLIKAVCLRWETARLGRWPKVAAYVKQQLADPRYIDASEAPAMFRPPRPEP